MTQLTSPELRRQHDAYFTAVERLHKAKADRKRQAKALNHAEQHKASREERKSLKAALEAAINEVAERDDDYQHALKDYQRLPLERDTGRVIQKIPPCQLS